MELLSIGFKDQVFEIISMLEKRLQPFNEEINIEQATWQLGGSTYITYELKNEQHKKYGNALNIFKHYIANALADIIIQIYEEEMVRKKINERCYYFKTHEKDMIYWETTKELKKNDYISTEGITYKISKKAKILKCLLDYLDENDTIHLEGFIRFRLRFFMKLIEDTIEKLVEDFLIEKEYKEFIKILQYFVDIQDPKMDVVNVLVGEDGSYRLYDKEKHFINNDFLEEIANEVSDDNMSCDDLLVSSLITIAPEKIIVHLPKSRGGKVLDIINNVFVGKVQVCRGCDLCMMVKQESHIKK